MYKNKEGQWVKGKAPAGETPGNTAGQNWTEKEQQEYIKSKESVPQTKININSLGAVKAGQYLKTYDNNGTIDLIFSDVPVPGGQALIKSVDENRYKVDDAGKLTDKLLISELEGTTFKGIDMFLSNAKSFQIWDKDKTIAGAKSMLNIITPVPASEGNTGTSGLNVASAQGTFDIANLGDVLKHGGKTDAELKTFILNLINSDQDIRTALESLARIQVAGLNVTFPSSDDEEDPKN